jgi:pathogenesis-related protein 1
MLLTAKILLTLLVARGLVAAQDAPKADGGDDLSYAISLINQARQAQGLQPLAWNSDLAAYASFWANQMATGSVGFEHASGRFRPDQGETLYERRSSECDFAYNNPLSTAVNTWLAEGAAWDGSPVSSGQESWLHWCT